MAASATQNPAVRSESKSAKKKKAKAEAASETAASTPGVELAPSSGPTDSSNGDGSYESPYIKELYKNIRNVNKKITNASKVDNILTENPGKSLDELVASRKINTDQKAQILKKPALQASLAQLEEQISQYKKFDQEYKVKLQTEKAEFEKTFTERASKELKDAIETTKAEAQENFIKEQSTSLLLLSQFLRLAAISRGEDENSEKEQNKALEGLLAQVYTGDSQAVEAMLNLIQGSTKTLKGVDGEYTTVTYEDIKTVAHAQTPASAEPEAAEPEAVYESTEAEAEPVETAETPAQSDPTIANAGLTELDAPNATTALPNGGREAYDAHGIPQNSGFGDGAANAAAEANWDNANDLSTSQEWVEVPRDAAETNAGITATPAAPSNTQSWADAEPDSPAEKSTAPAANNNDGFHEVQRSRGGQHRGQGQFRGGRGRGGGEGYRGRGNFRGGEGGYRGSRGGRGGSRGGNQARRTEES